MNSTAQSVCTVEENVLRETYGHGRPSYYHRTTIFLTVRRIVSD